MRSSSENCASSPCSASTPRRSSRWTLPVGETCRPTATCAAVCYAAAPDRPLAWNKSLRKRLRNKRYIEREDSSRVVAKLAREFRAAQRRLARRAKGDGKRYTLEALRVNGSGDLFPALIPVLNLFAAQNPDVRVWIVTRRFDLAAQVQPLPNVYIQLSVDVSTPRALKHEALRIAEEHPRAYLSFLRTSPDDDVDTCDIVFNQKGAEGLPYNPATDCPGDAGRLSLGNVRGHGGTAFAKCKKCFSESVLTHEKRTPRRATARG